MDNNIEHYEIIRLERPNIDIAIIDLERAERAVVVDGDDLNPDYWIDAKNCPSRKFGQLLRELGAGENNGISVLASTPSGPDRKIDLDEWVGQLISISPYTARITLERNDALTDALVGIIVADYPHPDTTRQLIREQVPDATDDTVNGGAAVVATYTPAGLGIRVQLIRRVHKPRMDS